MGSTIGALQAAKYLVELAHKDGISDLTPLKLQKILYYVEGWLLGNDIVHDELFFETPHAWKYGPVYRPVYDRFSHTTTNIDKNSLQDVDAIDDRKLKQSIKAVWNVYKGKTARELVDLTHETTPYVVAYENSLDDSISKSDMREYFRNLAYEN
jgi:uncharacterized phage-associated protein